MSLQRKNMFHMRRSALLLLCAASMPTITQAQIVEPNPPVKKPGDAARPDADQAGDIIVTARKRSETSLSVPISIAALTGDQLQAKAVNKLEGLTELVPGLQIAPSGGVQQGGLITIRGNGGSESNPFADQPVSFNVDGVQVSSSSIMRIGQLDLAQVEVLKGPQTLFFGKNSPGGVISLRSADPTPIFEGMINGAYEAVGREFRTEGFISGPLSDTLGVRVAFYGSHMNGWEKNIAPRSSPFASQRGRFPHDREMAGRITLKWNPSTRFAIRGKLSYGVTNGDGQSQADQLVDCPLGLPQSGGGNLDECKANNKITRVTIGSQFFAANALYQPGSFSRARQTLASVEANYKITDQLTLTSVSGLYQSTYANQEEFSKGLNPAFILPSNQLHKMDQKSTELRLTSSFAGLVNFLVGGTYQESHFETRVDTISNALAPVELVQTRLFQRGNAYSVFGQLILRPTDTIELSGGGRYSHEEKNLILFGKGVKIPQPVPHVSFNNFSPEVILSWKPDRNLNIYGGYRTGFLSGGYGAGGGATTTDRSYGQQTTRGFEGGAKLALAGGHIRANLAAYSYTIKGLQITTSVTTATSSTQVVTNAGKSRTKGVEFDLNWRDVVPGLTLRGGIAYGRARYARYSGTCYNGQSIELGCNLVKVGTKFTQQNLAGQQIVRSPDWTGNVAAQYGSSLSSTLKFDVSADLSFSSSYFASPINSPGSRQRGYQTVGAAVRVMPLGEEWVLSLIGKNLTNTYFISRSVDTPGSGRGSGIAGPLIPADTTASVSRGRQIMVRAQFRFR